MGVMALFMVCYFSKVAYSKQIESPDLYHSNYCTYHFTSIDTYSSTKTNTKAQCIWQLINRCSGTVVIHLQ
jgi:hypothetical protein